MKTEQEIRKAIADIITEYERVKPNMPTVQHWISMSYFNSALLWVLGDIKEIPDVLLPIVNQSKSGK